LELVVEGNIEQAAALVRQAAVQAGGLVARSLEIPLMQVM